jgi:chromosome partitioning protein
MPIIALSNQKGGVGKTTLTIHLAAHLARGGSESARRQVIIVDADPQGNASSYVLDGDTAQASMFELLVVGRPALSLIQDIPTWNLRLLSGNHRTGEAYIFLAATGKPFSTVAQLIRPLANAADYVLIDMPPSRAAGFRETLFAADLVLIPTQLERLSLEGVAFMAQTCRDLETNQGHGPRLLGIIPNLARPNTAEHRAQMAELAKAFGSAVWPPVPLSVRVAEACSFGQSVFDAAPGEPVTKALQLVGERLIENVEGRQPHVTSTPA